MNYLLVHGGDRDGSIWNEVAELLCRYDNTVFCPSMTSIKKTTLQHNINEICDVILANNLESTILVGHSYGAMVITGVLDKLADKIAFIVYVDSVIPKTGKSLYGILADNGFNYEDFSLTADKPCVEPLYFDENKLREKRKAYIHCLKSEFLEITKPVYASIQNEKNNWMYFSLDTNHACMLTQPRELATILFGVQLFIA